MDKPFVQTSEGIVNLLHVDFIQFRNGRGQIHLTTNREIVLSGDQFDRFMAAVARYRLIDVTHSATATPPPAAVAAPPAAPVAPPRPATTNPAPAAPVVAAAPGAPARPAAPGGATPVPARSAPEEIPLS